MAKKKLSPKDQKARKQKMIIAIGGVILLAVLAIQAPRMMKLMRGGGESNAAPYKAFSEEAVYGPAAKPISLSASGKVVLPDRDAQPQADAGQLVDFELFPSKDPFIQQVKLPGDGESTDAGTTDKADKADESGGGEAESGGSESARPTSAVISVNGAKSDVSVGNEFPTQDPAFVLVSASGSSVRIGIAGGSLSSGAQTVTLQRGHTLTLVNTIDGTEYKLRLLSVS